MSGRSRSGPELPGILHEDRISLCGIMFAPHVILDLGAAVAGLGVRGRRPRRPGPRGLLHGGCAAGSTRRHRRVHLIAILPTTLISLKVCLVGGDDGQALLGTILLLGFLGFAASEILWRLVRQDRVTADTVLGGIGVYLLWGTSSSTCSTRSS